MYKVIKNGDVFALTERPNFVRRHEGGYYVLCEEHQSNGIAVDGTVYHLNGTPALDGCEDVTVVEVDAGKTLTEKADKKEVQDVWDQMQAAYAEGVNAAYDS